MHISYKIKSNATQTSAATSSAISDFDHYKIEAEIDTEQKASDVYVIERYQHFLSTFTVER